MNRKFHLMGLVVCLALTLSACVPVPPAVPTSEQPDVSARIANAMSAAPMAVARDATIIDWPAEEGGPMVVLRQGTNNWTCITDWPASPGNDPSCNDPVWTAWNDAYAAGKPPEITGPGIAYMLVGGSDPSNTDPMATAPAAGEDWVTTPPTSCWSCPAASTRSSFHGSRFGPTLHHVGWHAL